MLNIGERIRAARQKRGFSQGDLEERTGLLRCYLSRVENGHTEPSLQTLVRIAGALELPLVELFTDGRAEAQLPLPPPPPQLSEQELIFLTQMRQYASMLNDQDRQQVLGMARKMAAAK